MKLKKLNLIIRSVASILTANQGFSLPIHKSVKFNTSDSIEKISWDMTGEQIEMAINSLIDTEKKL